MPKPTLLVVALLAGAALAGCGEAPPELAARCALAALAPATAADTVLEKAERRDEPVPHCVVEGFVTTTDPGPNRNRFRLQLPDDFAGRYYFIGLGGAAGGVPNESQSPAGNPIVGGFAVAGTDTGHEGAYLDWSFVWDDRAAALDHNDRGAHVVAVATQRLTRAYYGVPTLHRYHAGCSGGGRMGTVAAALHPEDYDGILIGAPALSSGSALFYMWVVQKLAASPAHALPAEKLPLLEAAVMRACDTLDGVADEMIWDPRACRFDVASLACAPGADASDCFTAAQLESIAAILAGPSTPAGPVYPGAPLANATSWKAWFPEAAQRIGDSFARAYFGPGYDFVAQFDFDDPAQVEAWWQAAATKGFGTRSPVDYGAYERAGGKVIFWQGMSDPGVSPLDQLAYFEEIRAALGDDARFWDFAALYLVPGALHCGGGTGPVDVPDRLFEALIAWVERGVAPGPVVAQRGREAHVFPGGAPSLVVPPPGLEPREFLLCPYPQRAAFRGDPEEWDEIANATRWECRAAR